MKIIKPSIEFFGAVPTDYNEALKFIEKAGRTCYKSEDKITEDSAEKFVRKLINAGHLAMVEHSNFVIKRKSQIDNVVDLNKYLTFINYNGNSYIGGNLTAWYNEGTRVNWNTKYIYPFVEVYRELFGITTINKDTSNYWKVCPHNEIPKELHRYSAKFICDRGVSHELVRHRPCSFAQESTRYVNYSRKDIEFINPSWLSDEILGIYHKFDNIAYDLIPSDPEYIFLSNCLIAEETYKSLLSKEWQPQQARAVLPNSLKTEIIVTADAAEWQHIRVLRTSSATHPDMQRLMNMMPWEEFL